jgi:hypothetical protein
VADVGRLNFSDIAELVLFVILAAGFGLLVGSFSVAAGIGAALLVLAACGLVWLIAYEKGV